jgi:hypothetical protein
MFTLIIGLMYKILNMQSLMQLRNPVQSWCVVAARVRNSLRVLVPISNFCGIQWATSTFKLLFSCVMDKRMRLLVDGPFDRHAHNAHLQGSPEQADACPLPALSIFFHPTSFSPLPT